MGNTETKYRNVLPAQGELNATSGGATGRADICRNKGGMAVPKGKGERLIQAAYL